MDPLRPLQSFPDIASKPLHYSPRNREEKKEDMTFRSATMGMMLVVVLLSGGLYFFGSSLNQTAAARQSDRLVKDELSGLSGELEAYKETDLDPDSDREALNDFDLLKEE